MLASIIYPVSCPVMSNMLNIVYLTFPLISLYRYTHMLQFTMQLLAKPADRSVNLGVSDTSQRQQHCHNASVRSSSQNICEQNVN